MSLHHDRLRAQHGYPLHQDRTEDLETGIAAAVREIDELRNENERLREALRAIARHGTAHDLYPTRLVDPDTNVNERWWLRYIAEMDLAVRNAAAHALDGES
ncbi:hypothetical protein F8M49_29995 [Rhodococcus zopfii]|uniref:Uncharacterized protein n=1 Tax=Rhodococcus zopfii TaxID=43772 RepID=A0ABU3WJR1_9NOCA|nr:hypothetical protein [Rhodococcus zopfii]MDV2478594.1 hypothetical protein [Rhodococcus zopfii]